MKGLARVANIIKNIPGFEIEEVKIKSKFVDLYVPVFGRKRTEEVRESLQAYVVLSLAAKGQES